MAKQEYRGKGYLEYKDWTKVSDWVLVVNYGSDLYTSLVNCVSNMGVNVYYINHKFCTDKAVEDLLARYEFKAIVLSGSARSVTEPTPPKIHPALLEANIPVLAICYSMEWLAIMKDCQVVPNRIGKREEGPTKLIIEAPSLLWKGLDPDSIHVHMFHIFEVAEVPEGFTKTASTGGCEIAAFERDQIYCVQFHPEFPYSLSGKLMMRNFFREVCGIQTLYY